MTMAMPRLRLFCWLFGHQYDIVSATAERCAWCGHILRHEPYVPGRDRTQAS